MYKRNLILIPLMLALLALLTGTACDTGTDGDGDDGGTPGVGIIYVVDKMNDRLIGFDYAGEQRVLDLFVTRPTDIDIHPGAEKLWVADYANDRASLYDLELDFERATADGLVNDPYTVAMLSDGGCWVADRVNGDFVRFDDSALPVCRLDADGPTRHVAYDSARELVWLGDENGTLYVVDADWSTDGAAATAAAFTVDGLGVIRGLVVDGANGRVWVSDFDGDRLICLDSEDGGLLGTVENLDGPMGLAAHPDGDCWVAVREGGRVLRIDGASLDIEAEYDELSGPEDVAVGEGDDCWVVEATGNTLKLLSGGETTLTVEGLSSPCGVEYYEPPAAD